MERRTGPDTGLLKIPVVQGSRPPISRGRPTLIDSKRALEVRRFVKFVGSAVRRWFVKFVGSSGSWSSCGS